MTPRTAAAFSIATIAAVSAASALWDLVATIGVLATALFLLGALLWLQASADKKLDEIGRSLMLGVGLAVAVGVPQYLLDQRQKDRDFVLALTLQQDLTGADLHDMNLSEVRLQGKVLAQADLRDARLQHARLVETDLRGADLRGANLQDADLRGAELDGAALDGADLTGARLKDADLTQASLPKAILTRVQLQNANLSGACLADAQLQDADLGGVELAGAVLTSANVQGTKFESDLRPASGLNAAGLAHLENPTQAQWPRGFSYTAAVERPSAPAVTPRRDAPSRIIATAVEVTDGDTVRFALTRGAPLPHAGRASLIGVNAPDPDDADGPAAIHFIRQRLSGKRVRVDFANDRTDDGGRLLVYIWLSRDKTLNETLLAAGYATYRPDADADSDLAARLRAAETLAKQRGVGLWKSCPTPEERIAPEGVKIRTT